MPRRLLVLNAVLALMCVAFAIGIVRTLLARHPVSGPVAPRAAVAPPALAVAESGHPGPEAYAVIAQQNLFNPARSEAAVAAVAVAKPILHGIVIHGAMSRAFLEDPTVKRIAGYSVGDAVGGGRLQKIADDRIVIARPEGLMEVLLQDPSKPRPAPTATAVSVGTAAPGQLAPGQGAPGQSGPGLVPGPVAPGQVVAPQPGPAANQPPPAGPQFRRRLSPPGQPGNDQ